MNPRPIVARIKSPWHFFNIAETLLRFYADAVPLSLTEDVLFTVIADQYQLAEIKLSVWTEGPAAEASFLLPSKMLEEFLSTKKRFDQDDEVRIAIFERIGRIAVVYSGTDEHRFSAKLVAAPADWDRLCDFDYRLTIPFDVGLFASMRCFNIDIALVTVRATPAPEFPRVDESQGRLVVFTVEAGGTNPKLDHYFVEQARREGGKIKAKDGEECGLLRVDTTRINVRTNAEYEHILTAKVGFELLWKVCRYLRKLGEADLCFPVSEGGEPVPLILEYGSNLCKIKWAIVPVKEE